MIEIGFDIARDLILPTAGWPSFRPRSPVTSYYSGSYYSGRFRGEGVTTRDVSPRRVTTGDAFLRSLPLPLEAVVARARSAGRSVRLEEPEIATWKIRLAVERGIVRPAYVNAPPLPGGYEETTAAVWSGFVFLLACKWLYAYGTPTVFSREFAAPWCGVSVRQARDAITALKRAGFMVAVGTYRRSTLWLPKFTNDEGGGER